MADLISIGQLVVGILQAIITGSLAYMTYKLSEHEAKPPQYVVAPSISEENEDILDLVIINKGLGAGNIREIEVLFLDVLNRKEEKALGRKSTVNVYLEPEEIHFEDQFAKIDDKKDYFLIKIKDADAPPQKYAFRIVEDMVERIPVQEETAQAAHIEDN